MDGVRHLTLAELEAGMDDIRRSPQDAGVLAMIVRRPKLDEREVLDEGTLTAAEGLVGDAWRHLGSSRTADGSAHPDMQLTLMNMRAIALLAQSKERWPLAGDQLYVDLDLSNANLPPGTMLSVGTALIQVTDQPHTGCAQFLQRFGVDGLKFVNSPAGKELHLRGIYTRVVQQGVVRVGDVVKKV